MTLKEKITLYERALREYKANPTHYGGLCSLFGKMYRITEKELAELSQGLQEYREKHQIDDGYIWPPSCIAPRIEYLESRITELKEQLYETTR
jgi:hypothetical protein